MTIALRGFPGHTAGLDHIADQKLPIIVKRVRDREAQREVPRATYAGL